ncbi:MAG: hypothetical protein E7529_03080 [Ruminococcaceae bacterium]|nr:hypothetical protein [Oscillospiraceae bacterium]
MGLFKNKNTQNMTERQKLTARYNGARSNILLVIAFTLINSVLLFTGSDSYFLFSAAIPYYMTLFGLLYTGRMPAEWYEGVENFQPDPDVVLYVYVAVAVVIVALYALMWFLSKKHGYGWLVAALLLFVADTFAMFYYTGFTADMILDFVFHIWVLVSLTSGIIAAINLKKLPEEEPYLAQDGQTYSYIPQAEAPIENNEVYAPVEVPAEAVEETKE